MKYEKNDDNNNIDYDNDYDNNNKNYNEKGTTLNILMIMMLK